MDVWTDDGYVFFKAVEALAGQAYAVGIDLSPGDFQVGLEEAGPGSDHS